MPRLTVANVLWLAAYLAMVGLLTWKLFEVRRTMVAALDTQEEQEHWNEWRRAAAKPGPVERRVPKSPEPNLLVLLRDYFTICLTASLGFSSLLFLVMMIFLRGAFQNSRPISSAQSGSNTRSGEVQ